MIHMAGSQKIRVAVNDDKNGAQRGIKKHVRTIPTLLANPIVQVLIATALFALLYVSKYYFFDIRKAFRWDWLLCLDYFSNNTLFSGQPWCVTQSAVWFGYLWIFKVLVGEGMIRVTVIAANFLVNALIVYALSLLAIRTVGKHADKKIFWIMLCIYTTIVYYPYTMSNPDIALSMLLFLCGILINDRERFQWKHGITAGILFSLASLVKLSTGFFAGAYILSWLFFEFKKTHKTQKQPDSANQDQLAATKADATRLVLVRGMTLILPGILLVLTLLWIYPHYIDYAITIGLAIDTHPILEVLTRLFYTNILLLKPFNCILYVMLAILCYCAWKQRSALSYATLFGALLLFYTLGRELQYQSIVRFFAPMLALTIMIAYTQYRSAAFLGKMALLILLGVVFLPRLGLILADVHKNDIRTLVERPFQFIPNQQGYGAILGEDEALDSYRYFLRSFYNGSLDNLDILIYPQPLPFYNTNSSLWDARMKSFINLSWWEENRTAQNTSNVQALIPKIAQGRYSAVFLGPLYWEELTKAVGKAADDSINHTLTDHYCFVSFPYLEYFTLHDAKKSYIVVFKEPTHCNDIAVQTFAYFTDHFDEICRKSPHAARVMLQQLRFWRLDIPRLCQKQDWFLFFYTYITDHMDNIPYLPQTWGKL